MRATDNVADADLQRAARRATDGWPRKRADIAMRALGLSGARTKESLDAIASDVGVSRETVRRARNSLIAALEMTTERLNDGAYAHLKVAANADPNIECAAAARALRRLLTMTGPLSWGELLTAWERAGGRPPYTPLPADTGALRSWIDDADGLEVTEAGTLVRAVSPEPLDQVSEFLATTLKGHPGGLERSALLDAAEAAGLKASTIATTLSQHPAVVRLGRGTWALRGQRSDGRSQPITTGDITDRHRRARPTSFRWAESGALVIEFSVPRGPSPVVSVPRAVAGFVEGREFTLAIEKPHARVSVGNGKLWGFGPALVTVKLSAGQRAELSLDLLAGTATLTSAERKAARG